jgi:hypothetical protein
MIKEIVCKSWLEVQKYLYDTSWNETIGRFRSRFAFRGLMSRDYILSTTLQRMGGSFAQLEQHLLRTFRKYAYEEIMTHRPGMLSTSVSQQNQWNWLVLARHHGLPTRLLDWTYSPYVALHFATAGLQTAQPPAESVIWCVDYTQAHTFLPSWLQAVLQEEVTDVLTVEMLNRSAPDLTTFDAQASKRGDAHGEFVAFFEPPSLDGRVVNQFALLSLMSSAAASMDQWLEEHPSLCQKLILPACLQWEIRDKLDQANINERLLYPGLDGLCRWLARYYGPRPVSFPEQ